MSMLDSLITQTRTALLINEMQLGVCHPDHAMFKAMPQEAQKRGVTGNIIALADAFRAAGQPVFHLPCIHRRDFGDVKRNSLISAMSLKHRGMTEGSPEAAFMPGLEPRPEDYVSTRSSGIFAFLGTDLDLRLRRMGVETVVVTGVSTNLGIPGIVMAAVDFGYNVVIAEDCTAGSDPEVHDMIVREQLRLLGVVTSKDEIIAALSKRG
ncbi:nicotinamidase-related amidase [Sphingobium wenxiniae]|nr:MULTISPECIES: isochorismatase family cysteine hydrolase [Sphingobium]MBB6192003.1 nicotinamidase-related amidase [Sphingobium wenxiniae]WRD75436.1 isochorismatase family cysteine hydrolase [Sphingobium baderi]